MNGTQDPKDTSQVGDTSKGAEGTSEQPETFTKETQEKAVSDALSAAGRTAKHLEQTTKAIEAREQAIKTANEKAVQVQKDKDEAEVEAAKDDSDQLSRVKARQKARAVADELAKTKLDLEEERSKGTQRDADKAKTDSEVAVFEIATKHTVDAQRLKELSELTDGSSKAIEAIAQSMVKKSDKPPLTVDSGKTIGRGASWEQVRAAYILNPNNPATYQRYIEMRRERDAQK